MAGIQIGSMALWGESHDGSGRELIVLALADELVLERGVSKLEREMLQFESFRGAAPEFGGGVARPGDDPPDLIVDINGEEVRLELTQLSISGLRANVAQVGELAALVRAHLYTHAEEYPHLRGRTADIRLAAVPPRREYAALVADFSEVLREDVGFVGEGLQLVNGEFPERIERMAGFYGKREDGALITAQPGRDPGGIEVMVGLAAGLHVKITEIEAQVEALVAAKDRAENEVLLISTGVPDYAGASFPVDGYLFESLRGYELPTTVHPKHLSAVYLHHWPSFDYRRLYPAST